MASLNHVIEMKPQSVLQNYHLLFGTFLKLRQLFQRLISVSEIASVLKLIVEKYLKKWGATFPLMDLKMPLGRSTSRQGLLK